MKEIRLFEAFAGYGSQLMSLRRLEKAFPDEIKIVPVGISEIDPHAIKAYQAVHGDVTNYGDISKIDWSQVPDFDLFTYSSPCFVAGTLVLTERGYLPIEQLKVGDTVLTRDGSWQFVENIGCDKGKQIYRLSAMGCLDIECTDNHPFLIRTRRKVWINDTRTYKYEFDEPKKTKYADIEVGKSFVGIPIIKEKKRLDMSDELLWLLGRYVADGHMSKKDKIVILSIGERKIEAFERAVTLPNKVFKHTKSCYRAVFYSKSELYKLVSTGFLGHGSEHKFISPMILSATKGQLKTFLDGYMSGDGSYIEKSRVYEATTISRCLAQSIVLAVQKIYGVGCKIYFNKMPKTHVIEGRTVNQKDSYMVRWRTDSPKHQWYNDGDFIWYPVKGKQDTCRTENVYNITVQNNHTYTANNVCVFNCQDFSNAGKQSGGEEGSGTRSSLLWECRRAILAKKPKYLLMENVAALVQAKFIKLFNKWQLELESYGYKNFARVLNAKNYNVPQNRERIFMVSILDENAKFEFPRPTPLKRKLKDVLEKDVDERYYLSEERLQGLKISTQKEKDAGRGFAFKPKNENDETANSVTTHSGGRKTDNFIKTVGNIYDTHNGGKAAGIVIDDRGGLFSTLREGDNPKLIEYGEKDRVENSEQC